MKNKGLKWVSVWTSLGMYLVLIMGALVTKTGSGNGCGNSWPLCHGQFAPLDNIESLIEYSHRAVSGAVGILVVVQAVFAWIKVGKHHGVKFFAFASFFFTFLQALLGAAAVIWQQSSAVLALHFGISLAAFAAILLLTVRVFQISQVKQTKQSGVSKGIRNAIWGITVYSYIVVYLGAYVRHTSSGLACLDWPTCNGLWIPELTGNVGIQFLHRLAAFILILALCWLFFSIRKHHRNRGDLYYGSLLTFILVLLQALSGGYVVLSRLQLAPSLVHNAIISCLFAILCYLCFQTIRRDETTEATNMSEVMHG
jgi:heme a synthase